MKHVQDYYTYITEGKKQYQYKLTAEKDFNPFDLLNDLKPLGCELLDSEPVKGSKKEHTITLAMDDSKKKKVEEEIQKSYQIEEL